VLAWAAAELGGFVRGVKVRMGVPIALGLGLEPLRRAIAAAEELGVPVMCHVATAPPSIDEVLAELRPGDIVTHAFTGQSMRLTGTDRRTISAAMAARDAGIILDLGHGSGGFSFESAITLADAGIYPDTISTDLHQLSINGPMFDLPTCLTKMLALGMTLPDAVYAATGRPARAVGLSDGTGSLTVGGRADIAIFALDAGEFVLADVHHQTISTHQRLRCLRTIIGGTPVDPRPADPPAPWITLTEGQRAYYRSGDPKIVISDELGLADLGPPTPRDVDAGQVMASARHLFGIEGYETPAVDTDVRAVSTAATHLPR
jgi:dihydroorotase